MRNDLRRTANRACRVVRQVQQESENYPAMDETRSIEPARIVAGLVVVILLMACAFALGKCSAPALARPVDVTEPVTVDDIGNGLNVDHAGIEVARLADYLASITTTTTRAPVASTAPVGESVWDALAVCEAGSNWAYPPVAGGFSGGLMFHIGTWRAMGGEEFAPDAYLATREQQITIAERTRDAAGSYSPWPGCSARLGL